MFAGQCYLKYRPNSVVEPMVFNADQESITLATISPYSGDRLQMSESDICRRQIPTSKVHLNTESINIFIMVVDP